MAALIPLASLDAAEDTLAVLRRELPSLEAADFFTDDGLSLVLEHTGREAPVQPRAPAYVVLECAARADPTEELAAAWRRPASRTPWWPTTPRRASALWQFREAHTEAIAAQGVAHKMDVGVPLARLAEFLSRVPAVVASAPRARARSCSATWATATCT